MGTLQCVTCMEVELGIAVWSKLRLRELIRQVVEPTVRTLAGAKVPSSMCQRSCCAVTTRRSLVQHAPTLKRAKAGAMAIAGGSTASAFRKRAVRAPTGCQVKSKRFLG